MIYLRIDIQSFDFPLTPTLSPKMGGAGDFGPAVKMKSAELYPFP
jgi:hypothetical protein